MRLSNQIEGRRRGAFISQMERKRRSHLGRSSRLIRSGLNETIKPLIEAIGNVQSFEEVRGIANRNLSTDFMKSRYIDLYSEVGVDFANDTYSSIAPPQKSDKDIVEYQWRENMRKYVLDEVANRITLITNTTEKEFKRIVNNVVQQAQEDGQSVQDAAREIQKQIGFSNSYRAVRIARTEIVSASNHGSLIGAKSTGLQLKKVWIATRGDRTRDAHKDMDGRSVNMNEKFRVDVYDGKIKIGDELLEHPGDPKGSAGNVINCRCTQGYERII